MAKINKPLDLTKYVWAQTGQAVRPSNAKINQGWVAEIPPYQFENWIQNRSDTAIAHIVQHGVSTWDNSTEYQAESSYVQGTDGIVYKALTTNTNTDPVTDGGSNWERAFIPYSDYDKILQVENNLSDVADDTTAFNNIKQQATETSSGVAEIATQNEVNSGVDNTRIVSPAKLKNVLGNYADKNTQINAGGGLTGGGSLGSGATISLASPDSITSYSNNSVYSNGHSHNLDLDGFFEGSNQSLGVNGYQRLPGGLILQWGALQVKDPYDEIGRILDFSFNFSVPFPTSVLNLTATTRFGIGAEGVEHSLSTNYTNSSGTIYTMRVHGFNTVDDGLTNPANESFTVNWFAIGY